ncbi:hypothetical protein DPMN_080551 [Dreissena polymorpha]|uniref:Uncharacterized protein n=1 Tax=Dreissena polymorpha TaxID=45954 RepID=A0A9D3YVV1_DREPO|nr:hypothetical protein DPMN_080551 [Dreissena polymorpha]
MTCNSPSSISIPLIVPHAVKSFLNVDEVVEQLTLVLHLFLYEDSADLFRCSSPRSEYSLFFDQQFLGLNLKSNEYDA